MPLLVAAIGSDVSPLSEECLDKALHFPVRLGVVGTSRLMPHGQVADRGLGRSRVSVRGVAIRHHALDTHLAQPWLAWYSRSGDHAMEVPIYAA